MLTAIKGVYKNGQITLDETPPFDQPMEVIVDFPEEKSLSSSDSQTPQEEKSDDANV
jgi:hypothetical protein